MSKPIKKLKFVIALMLIFILLSQIPHGSALDVSCRAIKARESDEYSPDTAWELGYTGKGVNIAVMDSGVDVEHESLAGKLVKKVVIHDEENPPPEAVIEDASMHGTACAGIALGSGGSTDNNGDGEPDYIGVAKDAKLIDVDVDVVHLVIGTHEYWHLPISQAMQWIYDNRNTEWPNQPPEYYGIDVVSISLAGGGLQPDEDGSGETALLINKASDAGVCIVVDAENDGEDNETPDFDFIASADKAIIVGAVDEVETVTRDDDVIMSISGKGPRKDDGDSDPYDELKPDVVAPAGNIATPEYKTSNEYLTSFGYTSAATPHVAGVCALMLEANPYLTPDEVKQILLETAELRGTPEYPDYPFPYNKWNRAYGCGIVDAYAAVKRALELKPPEPNILPSISITTPENNVKVSEIITISGTAIDTDGNVSNVELKIDGNDWFNLSNTVSNNLEWNYSWNTKNVENGMHTIYARAYDGENYSEIISVDVNVYNKVAAGGEEKMKINPIYLISAAGIIGAVVIIVVCLLLFRRKRLAGLPVSVPPPSATGVPSPVTVPPPPVTGVPSVTAQCPNCGTLIEITSAKRPLKVRCSKCGTRSILR